MIRVAVVEGSASVRSLIRRVVCETDGMAAGLCSDDVVRGLAALDHAQHDVAVVGLRPLDDEPMLRVFALIAATPVPMLLLTPPLSAGAWALASRRAVGESRLRTVVLAKPDRPQGWEAVRHELPSLVRDLGRRDEGMGAFSGVATDLVAGCRGIRVVAVGASAGGPAAVCETLRTIGEPLRQAAVLVVQHIEADFVDGFIQWLGRELGGCSIAVAQHGEGLRPGAIRVAPAHAHLAVDRNGRLVVDSAGPPRQGHRPSVDVLLEALAAWRPAEVAAVLLSGMGRDGVAGLLALRRAGGLTIAQDPGSCAVFGMPRAAVECRAARLALPPPEIARLLAAVIARTPR